jgi:hypothetical protein
MSKEEYVSMRIFTMPEPSEFESIEVWTEICRDTTKKNG